MRPEHPAQQTARTCPKCGLVLSSDKLDGLCPSCLLATTLDTEDPDFGPAFWEEAPGAKPTPARTFSHFELLDELGRGGMGVVYRARDLNTERIVALKVLQAHHLDVPDLVLRFRSEVRAVSSLDHPYVLPIHEVGEHEGIPFFSMKLTTAGSLAQCIGNFLGKPRDAARLLAKVARGVQHAHERGILHRDLKPGNILLDAAGEPYVCDFGLAKWLEDDRKLTVTAAVLGTPHYIAPEQALGSKALTTAVDIYSLGAILYELLTGRPPFVGGTVLETLVASQEKTPDRPSSIAKNVPQDLETIALKALQLDPNARYATAGAFAEDLESYLAGRPIQARPIGAAGQLWRWAKRNPLPASLAAVLMTLLIVLAIGSTMAAVRIDQGRQRALEAEQQATTRLYQSLLAQAKASQLSGQSGQRVDALRALAQASRINPTVEVRNLAVSAFNLMDLEVVQRKTIRDGSNQSVDFSDDLHSATVATPEGDLKIIRIGDGTELARFKGSGLPLQHVLNGGGRYIAARYAGGLIRIWDVRSGQQHLQIVGRPGESRTVPGFAFDPSLTRFAVCHPSGGIEVHPLDSRSAPRIIAGDRRFKQLAFDPSGTFVSALTVTEPYELVIAAVDGSSLQSLRLPARASWVCWNRSATQLAAGAIDNNIYIIAHRPLQIEATLSGHRQTVTQVVFSNSGSLLASTDQDMTIRLWDLSTYSEQVLLTGCGMEPVLKFSPDDTQMIASDFATEAVLINVLGANRPCTVIKPESKTNDWATLVSSLDYSPDSRRVVSASFGRIQIWDSEKKTLVTSIPLDPGVDKNVRFETNQSILVASRKSGLLKFSWTGQEISSLPPEMQVLSDQPGFLFGSAPMSLQPFVGLTNSSEGTVKIVDLGNLAPRWTSPGQPEIWDFVFAPDLSWGAASYSTAVGTGVRVWDLHAQTRSTELPTGTGSTLTLSPDGQILVTTGQRGTQLWRTGEWSEPASMSLPAAGRAAFTADGKTLALCGEDAIHLVNVPNGKLIASLTTRQQHFSSSYRLRFSRDGRQLVAQGYNSSLQFWDLVALRRSLSQLALDWN